MKFFGYFCFLFVSTVSLASLSKKDPFEKIIRGKSQDKVDYFAVSSPHAKLSTIEFHVKAGWDAEKPPEYGITHLVEHLLFRDSKLKDNMSYLQVFEARGGQVNASVSSRKTRYTVTIPSQHSLWALRLLTKMLQNRQFTQLELEKAKRSVMIEIGEPAPFEKTFISSMEFISKIFPDLESGFFKTEFGVDFDKYEQPKGASRFNNSYLSLKQAQGFYESFYVPGNIQLFAAGNFNQDKALRFINKQWGHYKKEVKGRTLPEEDKPRLVDRPFYSIKRSSYPSINLGIKVADISMKDFFILKSHADFIADRIMKEVRNKKGETYTAYAGHFIYKRHGKFYVNMDTTSKAFKKNFKTLKTLLLEKPQEEPVKRADFEKARLLLKHSFKDSYEENAESLFSNLYLAERYQREYGFTGSPLKLIDGISLEEYNAVLKKYIEPKKYFVQKYPQYFLFYYEGVVIGIIFLLLSFFTMRGIIKKPFVDLFRIRFVKNIKPFPLKLYEFGLLSISVSVASGLYAVMERYIFYNNQLFQSHLFTGVYLPSLIAICLFVGLFMFLLSVSPKKIYLTDDSFYIKAIAYKFKRYPASEIEKFESIKWWKAYFSLNKLRRISYRFYIYRLTFPWTHVLLVCLANGKIILLDCGLTASEFKKLENWLSLAKSKKENIIDLSGDLSQNPEKSFQSLERKKSI